MKQNKSNFKEDQFSSSFTDFLFKYPRNRVILWMCAIVIIIQFAIFKYFYPHASYIHGDSFAYLQAARDNLRVNTYMVGYSMFLRLFSVFTVSDVILTGFQYLLLHCSALFFLFTLYYFYRPSKVIQMVLIFFMVFNPLFLHLGNLVSSDGLFLSLSLIWFTLMLWIIHRPNNKLILWHTIVILIAFTVRYNALIYFFISIIAFMLSRVSGRQKLVGIGSAAIVIALFVVNTANRYQVITGTWQYSPFAGWQLANNALYAYRYIEKSQRKPVPPRFQKLDRMVREYFDSTRDVNKHPVELWKASTVYMWDSRSPLYAYRRWLFKNDSTSSELKEWASMGPFYKDYGWCIIKQYPLKFAEHFLWPNAMKYYAPPVEFLESYNSGKDSVAAIARDWFRYPSRKLTTRMKEPDVNLLDFYPILSGMINVLMLFGLLTFAYLNGFTQNTKLSKGVLLASTTWIFNAGFTIFASSAALRFQSFPIILTTVVAGLLVDGIWDITTHTEGDIFQYGSGKPAQQSGSYLFP